MGSSSEPESAHKKREADNRASASVEKPKPKTRAKPRKLPGTDVVSDYTSPLLTHPDIVESWGTVLGYTHDETCLVLQYFEQVAQLKGQAVIDQIFATRSTTTLKEKAYHLLEVLDPLRMFFAAPKAGVPPFGFDLSQHQQPWGARPESQKAQEQFTPASKMFQLVGYKKTWEPLPVGTTCVDILQHYPNHLCYEFLDAFMQHGMNAKAMTDSIPADIEEKLKEVGLRLTGKNRRNLLLQSRFTNRREERMKIFGQAAEDVFITHGIKVRQSGLPKKLGFSKYQTESSHRLEARRA